MQTKEIKYFKIKIKGKHPPMKFHFRNMPEKDEVFLFYSNDPNKRNPNMDQYEKLHVITWTIHTLPVDFEQYEWFYFSFYTLKQAEFQFKIKFKKKHVVMQKGFTEKKRLIAATIKGMSYEQRMLSQKLLEEGNLESDYDREWRRNKEAAKKKQFFLTGYNSDSESIYEAESKKRMRFNEFGDLIETEKVAKNVRNMKRYPKIKLEKLGMQKVMRRERLRMSKEKKKEIFHQKMEEKLQEILRRKTRHEKHAVKVKYYKHFTGKFFKVGYWTTMFKIFTYLKIVQEKFRICKFEDINKQKRQRKQRKFVMKIAQKYKKQNMVLNTEMNLFQPQYQQNYFYFENIKQCLNLYVMSFKNNHIPKRRSHMIVEDILTQFIQKQKLRECIVDYIMRIRHIQNIRKRHLRARFHFHFNLRKEFLSEWSYMKIEFCQELQKMKDPSFKSKIMKIQWKDKTEEEYGEVFIDQFTNYISSYLDMDSHQNDLKEKYWKIWQTLKIQQYNDQLKLYWANRQVENYRKRKLVEGDEEEMETIRLRIKTIRQTLADSKLPQFEKVMHESDDSLDEDEPVTPSIQISKNKGKKKKRGKKNRKKKSKTSTKQDDLNTEELEAMNPFFKGKGIQFTKQADQMAEYNILVKPVFQKLPHKNELCEFIFRTTVELYDIEKQKQKVEEMIHGVGSAKNLDDE